MRSKTRAAGAIFSVKWKLPRIMITGGDEREDARLTHVPTGC